MPRDDLTRPRRSGRPCLASRAVHDQGSRRYAPRTTRRTPNAAISGGDPSRSQETRRRASPYRDPGRRPCDTPEPVCPSRGDWIQGCAQPRVPPTPARLLAERGSRRVARRAGLTRSVRRDHRTRPNRPGRVHAGARSPSARRSLSRHTTRRYLSRITAGPVSATASFRCSAWLGERCTAHPAPRRAAHGNRSRGDSSFRALADRPHPLWHGGETLRATMIQIDVSRETPRRSQDQRYRCHRPTGGRGTPNRQNDAARLRFTPCATPCASTFHVKHRREAGQGTTVTARPAGRGTPNRRNAPHGFASPRAQRRVRACFT